MYQQLFPYLSARISHLMWSVAGSSLLLSLQPIVRLTEPALAHPLPVPTAIGTNLSTNWTSVKNIARLDLTSPLPTTGLQNTRPLLKIGTLKNYRHPSNLFSIDIPQIWQLENFSEPNHVRVQWQDPNYHGLICVELFNFADRVSEAELGTQLSGVLRKVYGGYDRLNVGQPIAQSNGSIRVDWSYRKEIDDGSIVSYKGKSFIQQIGNKISASYYVVPAQQTTQLAAPFDRIIKSYQVNDVDIP